MRTYRQNFCGSRAAIREHAVGPLAPRRYAPRGLELLLARLATPAILCLLAASGCSRNKNSRPPSEAASNQQAAAPASTPPTATRAVQTEFRNVDFHVGSDAVLHVHRLRGELDRTRADVPPTFDDENSFLIKLSSGVVTISPQDLAALMNAYVFNYPDAPLHDIRMTITGDRIEQRGTLHKGVGIPFELEGTIAATPDGLVRLHSTKIKSAHLPVKGLMDLFGVKLAALLNLHESRGMRIDGDDIFLNPNSMLPPPRIEGKVSAAQIENGEVVLVFGSDSEGSGASRLPLPDPRARNYMYFRGGTLRFGRLTMVDSDLEIVDLHPVDPLDFDLAQYNRQLAAGYSKSTAAGALITFIPDLHRLTAATSRAQSKSGIAPENPER